MTIHTNTDERDDQQREIHPLERLAGSIALAAMEATLQAGHDIEIPALGIVIKSKAGETKEAQP